MNARELNFAYKVRHALNENLENIPVSTTEKLASARMIAVSRKRKESRLLALVPRSAFAGSIGAIVDAPLSWLSRVGLAIPLVVLAVGLTGIYQIEQERRISDIADIDAAVLADELPLSAYLDHGFNAFLAKQDD
jgi:ABC-type siderophore export system fused ATPase/permease subunit